MTKLYEERKFNIPTLKGLSEKQIAVHLGLYAGYVKHVNLIIEKIKTLKEQEGDNTYLIAELRRRFAFEFDGMRMHEYYFEQFEGSSTTLTASGPFAEAIAEKYPNQTLDEHIREVASTRGIGWVVVYKDPVANIIHTVFVNDHELGQLSGLPILLVLDLWEHAYMVDYIPSEKKNYVDAFFDNLNWNVIEKRFDEVK